MLSYQHAYHAGNPADVHKHAMLAVALAHLAAKPKPMCYFETHAGRGLYDLAAPEALKTGEAGAGIRRAEALGWFARNHPYAQALAATRARHGPNAYPGSPLIAAAALREGDRMQLSELHPQECAALSVAMAGSGARVSHADGLTEVLALTPPEPRRGIVVLDPSWEVKADYAALPRLIGQVHRKWNVGVLFLWYPILGSGAHLPMLAALEAARYPGALRHEVRFAAAGKGHGMTGSGLFIVNAPHALEAEAARLSRLFAALSAT